MPFVTPPGKAKTLSGFACDNIGDRKLCQKDIILTNTMFLRKMLSSNPEWRSEKDGKPLNHWEEFRTNKRVTTCGNEDAPERWIPNDTNFWKEHLSRDEYSVLREKGTEAPRSSANDKFYPETGYFACRACGHALYQAQSKFDSGSGWPSFGCCVENHVYAQPHYDRGHRREEVCCRQCGSHLGHVFAEKNPSKFGSVTFTERQCVNGVCLKYIKAPLHEGLNPNTNLL